MNNDQYLNETNKRYSEAASPTVYMDNPHNLRVLAQALLAAADWMEDGNG